MKRWDQLRAALTFVVAGGVAMVGACALPVESKNGCFQGSDCNGARACVDGTCQDDACGFVCDHIREAAGECSGVAEQDPRFNDACRGDAGFLAEISDEGCQSVWDRIEGSSSEDNCDVPLCAQQCQQLCNQAAGCALINDAAACKAGCLSLRPSCAQPIGGGCSDVPGEVQCYEARSADAC